MTETERKEQIAWFESLLEMMQADKLEDAVAAINAAIKLLRRNSEETK